MNETLISCFYLDYEYPSGIQAMGWIIEMLPVAVVLVYPIWTVYSYKTKKGYEGDELLQALIKPTQSWFDTPRGKDVDVAHNDFEFDNKSYVSEKDNQSMHSKKSYDSERKGSMDKSY